MLRRSGLCDWGRKDRPIENVNGLRASRDWGHGRDLKRRAGEVKPRKPGDSSRAIHRWTLQDGAFRTHGGAEPERNHQGSDFRSFLLSR